MPSFTPSPGGFAVDVFRLSLSTKNLVVGATRRWVGGHRACGLIVIRKRDHSILYDRSTGPNRPLCHRIGCPYDARGTHAPTDRPIVGDTIWSDLMTCECQSSFTIRLSIIQTSGALSTESKRTIAPFPAAWKEQWQKFDCLEKVHIRYSLFAQSETSAPILSILSRLVDSRNSQHVEDE